MDPETLVRGLTEAMSEINKEEKEKENPKPNVKTGDELKDTIIDMLTENTGAHILDSGDYYGRHWERNRRVKDWDSRPEVDIEVWDNEVIISRDLYKYLISYLEITDESKRLQKEWEEFIEGYDGYYLEGMEDFIEQKNYIRLGTTNTYNFENLLSQVLQYKGDNIYYDGGDVLHIQPVGDGEDTCRMARMVPQRNKGTIGEW